MAKLALSTKILRWMNEREWGLISPSSGKAMYQTAHGVAHVYLGSLIAVEHRKKLLRALAYPRRRRRQHSIIVVGEFVDVSTLQIVGAEST